MQIRRVRVENILRIDSADVTFDNNKIMLFGPNGSGKSSLIYGLLTALKLLSPPGPWAEVERVLPTAWQKIVREQGAVEVDVDGETYRVELKIGEKPVVKSKGGRDVGRLALSVRPAYVGPCSAASPHIVSEDFCAEGVRIEDPKVAEWIEQMAPLIGVEKIYVDKVKITRGGDEVWIDASSLAYGYKKALALLAASYGADLIVVEGFESGLHYDLAVALIHWLTDLDATVIVESHVALSVYAALRRKWSVYYVEDGQFRSVKSEEDLSKMAQREKEAYAWAAAP